MFARENQIGVFRGFREGGLEFHADLILPYKNEFQSIPMHGQFVLVQLETPEEAVLGRITSFSSEGKLSSGAGEEFNIRAMQEERPVPEDLREQYLKYRVNIRVLGVLRAGAKGGLTFVASHRRLPHVGSPVAFPSEDVLREVAGHNLEGAGIGHFALGEYIYAHGTEAIDLLDWMQIKAPEVLIRFPVASLVSRRTFVFARAGFGKSNLTKLLFSKLYEETPTVEKGVGRQVPVGTVIFDPDGEYFWPDDRGRPGLCDVPALRDKLVVFTSRRNTSAFYQSFVAGGIRLDIRRLRPADVIAIGLGPDRQDQQNVRKLRGLGADRWAELVDLIDRNANQTAIEDIERLLDLEHAQQGAEALAARANMTSIVRMLHDRRSQLMDMLLDALAAGKLCVVDVSQMREGQALILSGLILRRIFDRNQEEFTAAEPRTIPTIAVVEEAQTVLNDRATAAEPYISWVKEGRKYDLGAVLITQQPGSIPKEILSQGDNWFIFHLLSSSDLGNVRSANAHYSEDLLADLLNEPIEGQGVFWSSVGGKPYPVSIRILSFEKMYPVLDPDRSLPAEATFADELRARFEATLRRAAEAQDAERQATGESNPEAGEPAAAREYQEPDEAEALDPLAAYEAAAVNALRTDGQMVARLRSQGIAWGSLKAFLKDHLPESMDDRDEVAYHLVPRAMEEIIGSQEEAWYAARDQRGVMYLRTGPKPL